MRDNIYMFIFSSSYHMEEEETTIGFLFVANSFFLLKREDHGRHLMMLSNNKMIFHHVIRKVHLRKQMTLHQFLSLFFVLTFKQRKHKVVAWVSLLMTCDASTRYIFPCYFRT